MNRMFTKQEIIDLIDEHAKPFDPSAIEEGSIPQNGVLGINENGKAVKGDLIGKYVQILNNPNDNNLTDDEIDAIKSGAFVTSASFLSFKNPILYPPNNSNWGLISGTRGDKYEVRGYRLDPTNKKVNYAGTSPTISIDIPNQAMELDFVRKINTKSFPAYPQTSGSFNFKYVNGALTWQEGNGLYLHVIVFDVGSGQSFTLRFISDSSSACELDTVTGNFTIPGSTFIQPANMGNVVIVPLDANKFAPDIHAFNSSTGAFTDNITLASVTSDTVTPIG